MLAHETDPLTGLFNMDTFERKAKELLKQATKLNQPFSLAFLHLDKFRAVNDNFGFAMGDSYIRNASQMISEKLKPEFIMGRSRGKVFCIALPDMPPESAFLLLEDIRRPLNEKLFTFEVDGYSMERSVFLSGGIAGCPTHGKSYPEIRRAADEALYKSKKANTHKIALAIAQKMKTKTSYYTGIQIKRLSALAKESKKSESILLREALDDLLLKYDG